MKNRKVGVVGGMGPYATLEFCKKILDFSPVSSQSEHIRLYIDINPSIPNRTEAVFNGGDSPVPEIIHMVNTLASQEVDMVVIPCNNATYFLPKIIEATNIRLVSIIETTVLALDRALTKRVAVLGTYITFYKQTYRKFIELNGFVYLNYDENLFFEMEKAIQLIRDSGRNIHADNLIENVINQLLAMDVDTIILGCTELSLINIKNMNFKKNLQFIDSGHELARYIVSCYY